MSQQDQRSTTFLPFSFHSAPTTSRDAAVDHGPSSNRSGSSTSQASIGRELSSATPNPYQATSPRILRSSTHPYVRPHSRRDRAHAVDDVRQERQHMAITDARAIRQSFQLTGPIRDSDDHPNFSSNVGVDDEHQYTGVPVPMPNSPYQSSDIPPASGPQRTSPSRCHYKRKRKRNHEQTLVPFFQPKNLNSDSSSGIGSVDDAPVSSICQIVIGFEGVEGGPREAWTICGERFDTADRLSQHLEHDHYRDFVSPHANFDTLSPGSPPERRYRCLWRDCTTQPATRYCTLPDLLDHIIRDHTQFRIKCVLCRGVFHSRTLAVRHLLPTMAVVDSASDDGNGTGTETRMRMGMRIGEDNQIPSHCQLRQQLVAWFGEVEPDPDSGDGMTLL